MMYEVIERSCNTGAVSRTFGGFTFVEWAAEVADEMSADSCNEGYWYDVAQEGTV